ncbi:SDR family NAD(P)-dependent oxidoreductase [Pseudomonas sp. S75]|uniref:SDR family NAD(P)-dependent oxidoreductase n=1 Tax=unclassified Pseudomonas TaxID=196821 RepID=UPI0019050562|nr:MULTISPECIES: SDR family NAD(P)-dependent oxidoreductase [unclassified Pseudomonas]MBJ9974794.1 SDR family NAD(P)-dependent oxidoreductase [Pseudomonas sp. S30]MBK0152450.1 SDR family NAD(P)-dependent oxidoreductase [Pseudomonas sp. S75]
MAQVFITGVSTGIGLALARLHLARGDEVWGVSRRAPIDLITHPRLHFRALDLCAEDPGQSLVQAFIGETAFDTAYLNAGTFGAAPELASQTSVDAFRSVLELNLVAVKWVLDRLLCRQASVRQVVFSASVSGIRQRAGMLSYSVSKAALNALAKVYHLENPDVFFAVLGLCNVDTTVAQTILQADERFPELVALRERSTQEGYIVSPEQRAQQIVDLLAKRHAIALQSGQFYEIRHLLERIDLEVCP